MQSNDKNFKFGENWENFLKVLTNERIRIAEESLKTMLGADSLNGLTFLDVGSGSGLFSLCARRLGASVVSFDYDRCSVGCTNQLKLRYFPDDSKWKIMQGSVLDKTFLESIGSFDVVYAWGVLHHTGHMWDAMNNVARLVKESGLLFIAIYNDQGLESTRWKRIKRIYNQLPTFLRPVYTAAIMAPIEARAIISFWPVPRLNIVKNIKSRINFFRGYKKDRGMSYWHNLVDWVGGYPFEVAKPEEISDFYAALGFSLKEKSIIDTGWGNNQFVFRKQKTINK